ncbi:MAG: hypothetical protein ACJAWV_001004 [Flammeovirgaceae bacterium]|jgi:hypothetical protein
MEASPVDDLLSEIHSTFIEASLYKGNTVKELLKRPMLLLMDSALKTQAYKS